MAAGHGCSGCGGGDDSKVAKATAASVPTARVSCNPASPACVWRLPALPARLPWNPASPA